jgi:L-alanine-DL-glutamate epimerase-like enolase superfamily enzyme
VLFGLGELGLGEAPPVRYLQQDPDDAPPLLHAMAAGVDRHNLLDRAYHLARARAIAPTHSSARAAFDVALWDAAARLRGVSLRDFLRDHAQGDLSPRSPRILETSYTIALDHPEAMVARARGAAHLPILKIKLGRSPAFDADIVQKIRAAAPSARLRVDVNGGWDPRDAPRLCERMRESGVEFVEQPLPRGAVKETAALRRDASIPIFADEDVQDAASLEPLRQLDAVDGINLKLSKCGGITEALTMIEVARAQGWRVLLGCMIETSIGITAAAHIAPLVDHADLDGNLLITNDPYRGAEVRDGKLVLPSGPGLGVEENDRKPTERS